MQLLRALKESLYFPLAYYFRFFAEIRLQRWRPRVIVVTGSSGKTTLLNLIQSQLKERARYSHKANSSYGIPFDILGLKRKTFLMHEWLELFIKAPFAVFKSLPKEKIYAVEVDCDRSSEGRFLATLLKPEVTLWLNSSKTHSMNFDEAINPPAGGRKFSSIEKAIAYEFGNLLAHTSELAMVNGDSDLIDAELYRTKAQIRKVSKRGHLQGYQITPHGQTRFRIDEKDYSFSYLLPEDTFYSIKMTLGLMEHLKIAPDYSFSGFTLPPGRSSVFKGVKNITIVDSSYNANLDSMRVILDMFNRMPASAKASAGKWAVLGDMIEQGAAEKEEHEKLAELLLNYNFERVLLMGPRMSKYAYPKLETLSSHFSPLGTQIIEKFLNPTEVLKYLQVNIQGEETILFKGARFLEGVIEHLLADREDAKKLCRQEKVWKIRRKQWGL
ncbi:MAG: cyanophycin synthetase [Candidatus Colwellbacteria bacterium]